MLSNDKMDEKQKHNTAADMLQRQPVPSYESAVLQSASATAAQPTLKEPGAVNPSERVLLYSRACLLQPMYTSHWTCLPPVSARQTSCA